MNKSFKFLTIILCLSLFINPVWAFHTVHTDEVDFIIQADDHDNVGYFNIVNGSSAYLHNTYGTNATELLGNVTADTDTDIITTLAFLDNDLEETSATEVYDDDETYWAVWTQGGGSFGMTLSEETTIKTKGTSSIKMEIGAGASALIGIKHVEAVDYSGVEFIGFYAYGKNDNQVWSFQFLDSGGKFAQYNFVDNFNGWKRIIFAINNPDADSGITLALINEIRIISATAPINGVIYIDRLVFDVGQWVGVEISVPDTLDGITKNVRLYAWDGSAYDATPFMSWDAENDSPGESWDDSVLHFLDTSTIDNVYGGDIWDYMDSFLKGLRFATKDTVHVSSSNVIVYSDLKGVAYRVGFAVKMAPDDGLDNSTYGLSQFRFKADIYYDSNGETTVIHEGDEDSGAVNYVPVLLIGLVIAFITIFVFASKRKR